MSDDPWREPAVPVERPFQLPPLGAIVPRAFTLTVGTILIGVGSYYAISVLVTALRVAQDPASIAGALDTTVKILQLDQLQVPINDAPVSVGRLVAGVFLLPWYLISATIALKLVQLGARMVMGELAERREALTTMRVMLATLRSEIESVRPRKPS